MANTNRLGIVFQRIEETRAFINNLVTILLSNSDAWKQQFGVDDFKRVQVNVLDSGESEPGLRFTVRLTWFDEENNHHVTLIYTVFQLKIKEQKYLVERTYKKSKPATKNGYIEVISTDHKEYEANDTWWLAEDDIHIIRKKLVGIQKFLKDKLHTLSNEKVDVVEKILKE